MMRHRSPLRASLLVALIALPLAACTAAPPEPSPAASASGATVVPPASTAPPAALFPTPALPTQPPAPEPTRHPILEQTSGSLTVRLFATEDVLVATPAFSLEGQAPPGTVVSANQAVLVVGESGQFSVEVPLEEGPNLLEVIASSPQGDEVSFLLTITFEPSPEPS